MLVNNLILQILFFGLITTGTVFAKKTRDDQISEVIYKDCWFEVESNWPRPKCGTLIVPENYSVLHGRKVRLPFIIFQPFEKDQVGVPLLVTGGGGPGGGLRISSDDAYTMEESIWSDWYSSAIDNGLPLILIDNRGVGSSQPRLDCDEVERAEVESLVKGLSGDAYINAITIAHKSCKDRLDDAGIDLDQYHVSNAAKDIDQLRVNLGFNKLNLYGISYGTRVALMYEKLFPSTTRALILDGVYPLFVRSSDEIAALDSKIFDDFFSRCKNDSRCSDKVGDDFRLRFEEYLTELEENNFSITVTSPDSLAPIDIEVTPGLLMYAVRSAMYDESKVKRLPKMLRSIMSGGVDYLAELIRNEVLNNLTVNSLDEAAYALYSCYDEIPFSDIDLAIEKVMATPILKHLNLEYLEFEKQLCQIWGRPPAPEKLKDRIPPNAPTLIYSGELDPITPPKWAEELHELSKKSWIFTWPNIGHGVMAVSSCADWVAADFLKSPDKNPLFLACVNERQRFKFDL